MDELLKILPGNEHDLVILRPASMSRHERPGCTYAEAAEKLRNHWAILGFERVMDTEYVCRAKTSWWRRHIRKIVPHLFDDPEAREFFQNRRKKEEAKSADPTNDNSVAGGTGGQSTENAEDNVAVLTGKQSTENTKDTVAALTSTGRQSTENTGDTAARITGGESAESAAVPVADSASCEVDSERRSETKERRRRSARLVAHVPYAKK